MKRKVLAIVLAVLLTAVIFTGCGGGSNSSNGGGNSIKPTTAHLTVSVTDNSGNSIENAKVTVNNNSGTTKSNGTVVFDTLNPGDYTVKSSKDGYEDAQKNVSLKAGDQTTVPLILRKKAEESAEALKDVSKLKSYRLTFDTLSSDNKSGKMFIEENNFGKEQHMAIYNDKGEVEMEFYNVDGKVELRSGKSGKWIKIPESSAKAMTDTSLEFANNMLNGTIEDFNKAVKDNKGGSVKYEVKRVGNETMNGYPTYKYHLYLEGHDENGTGIVESYIWVINRGEYKDYTTRMLLSFKDTDGKKSKVTINLTDIGKNLHITLP